MFLDMLGIFRYSSSNDCSVPLTKAWMDFHTFSYLRNDRQREGIEEVKELNQKYTST